MRCICKLWLATLTMLVSSLLQASLPAQQNELSFRIERTTIATGTEKFYFAQARAARVPGSPELLLVTMQETEKEGSHGYRDLFQIESRDQGKTWTSPAPIESLRRQHLPLGDDFVMGDVCPQWHAKTGKVLATGKTFTFHDRTKEDRSLERVSYSVYSPQAGTWSGLQLVDLPKTDHEGKPILQPNSGCCQRFDLPDGDILLPIRYCKEAKKLVYTTIVARCRFDGTTLFYIEHGSELSVDTPRGLYEPSLAKFGEKYYLTLRNDERGYVARSDDGLNYEPPVEWKYDDGSPLGNYNTQQHWVAHRDGLFLVYTRRAEDNGHIFRHRAPLFIARIDPDRLCVVRETEQILVPHNHADLGNFGVVEVSPAETWVVVAEYPAIGKRKAERNEVFAVKILWSRPNGP